MYNRVSALVESLAAQRLLTELGLPALTVLFGVQALRVVLPGLVWGLVDASGWDEKLVGAIAVLLFLTSFFAVGLQRFLGSRCLIIAAAGGLGLLRLLMQVWAAEPMVGLSLAMGGMVLLFLFVPAYLLNRRASGGAVIRRFVLGLLLGLILDTTLHGAFHSYDISWQSGLLPLLLTLLLVLAQWILLAGFISARNVDVAREGGQANRNRFVNAVGLVAIGPFLFLQVVVLQNVARLAALTEWPLPTAFGWTLLADLAGLVAAVWLLSRPSRNLWPLALVSGVGLVATLAISYPEGAVLTAMLLLLGQLFSSLLITLAFPGARSSIPKTGFVGVAIASAVGMVLLLVFLMAYYLGYYFSLPYSNTTLEPVAGFVMAVCALRCSIGRAEVPSIGPRAWLVVVVILPLLVVPLAGVITWRAPTAVSGEGFPVRVVTYNVHNGFNTEGRLDMEAIALTIEECDPDIVALQEVSRGWVINGRLDMVSWLSQRLDMPYVFGPTADPFWGNAILSRYPIVEYAHYDLPPRDLPVLRGFTVALVDLGNGDRLQVIATHFHHVEGDTGIRLLQSRAIVNFWGGDGRTVLAGDLNADPHAPEIELLRQAGLVDAVARIEPPPVYTWPSVNPNQRIDYIWVSPDLTVTDICVPMSNASDHLPVVAEIDR